MKLVCINNKTPLLLESKLIVGDIYNTIEEDELSFMVSSKFDLTLIYKFSKNSISNWHWEKYFKRLRDVNLDELIN